MFSSLPSHGSSVSSAGLGLAGPGATDLKGGELFEQDGAFDHGHYQSETEEEGVRPWPQPLPATFAAGGYTSHRGPYFGGYLPYYYDYRFLKGLYPKGTYTHSSISHSHGLNNWNDVHYVRDDVPYGPRPERPPQTSSDPAVPKNIATTGQQQNFVVYQGPARGQQLPRQGNFVQQGYYRVQTPGQVGGMGKV